MLKKQLKSPVNEGKEICQVVSKNDDEVEEKLNCLKNM